MSRQREISLFDIPSNAGCLEFGTELLPVHFRRHGLIEHLERSGAKVSDLGSVTLPELERHNQPPIRNYPSPKMVWEKTASFFDRLSPLDEDGFYFCLGGDCSIVVGTVSGMVRLYSSEQVHILYIDGDTDSMIPDPKQCIGSAGMGLYFLTNESDYWSGGHISPSQVTIIGNKEEPPSGFSMPTVSLEHLRADGIPRSISEILKSIPPDRKLFVHFDVDVLSNEEMPAAYAPRDMGLSLREVEQILTLVLADRRMAFLEVTEFVPAKDPEGKHARSLIEVISQALAAQKRA